MTYVLLAILNRWVNQLGIFGLLGGREDQGRVCGGILRLVFLDGCELLAAVLPQTEVYLLENSPLSQTTVVPVAFSWSREVDML